MATTPEGRVKLAIRKWLEAQGAYYYMPSQNGRGRVGIPDFVACINGQFWGIEAKAPGKTHTTTKNQERELAWIARAGGVALVVSDVKQLEDLCSSSPSVAG